MELFEKLALRTAPVKFCLSKRYADDNCSIVKVKGLQKPCEPSICFIVEMKRARQPSFLDTFLRRSDNGNLDATVYRTHGLVPELSLPPSIKRGLVRCMYDKARNITIRGNFWKEERHLTKVLQ